MSARTREERWGGTPSSLSLFYQHPTPGQGWRRLTFRLPLDFSNKHILTVPVFTFPEW